MSNLGNKEILAKNLSHYVEHSGRDQREVADAVGVAPSTFNEWIKGKKYPRVDKIQMLAEYFGIRMSDLIEEVGDSGYNPSEPQLTGVDKELWDVLKLIPKEQKVLMLDMIRGFANNLNKD